MSEAYQPIPVVEARILAEKFNKSVVIICAHDPVHGVLHTTTYGVSPRDKQWAAEGGEIVTKALGYLPELRTDFEDYRIKIIQDLLAALRTLCTTVESRFEGLEIVALVPQDLRRDIEAAHAAIEKAQAAVWS